MGEVSVWRRLSAAGVVLALVALTVPRLHSGSALWLDEALSVNIARLPLADLFTALRHDGSPPVYYLALHYWIALFGDGDEAVRSLSTLFSVLALPVGFAVGRRLERDGSTRTGLAVVLIVAASPFAIRYATETRMYALLMLEALCWLLAVLRALDRSTRGRIAVVVVLSALLALTHYWALFFLAAAEVLLLVAARRGGRGPRRLALAMPLAGILFVPWLPSFLYQAKHTGTPWRPAPRWTDAGATWFRWAGPGPLAVALGIVLLGLVLLAMRHRVGRQLVGLGIGGLLLGLAVCRWQGSAYALRYSAPLLAPVLVAQGLGLAALASAARRIATVAVVALSLCVVSFTSLLGTRTQAADLAAVLNAQAGAGDWVVFCPDQLGPSTDRLITVPLHEVVYPTLEGPELVDWVDYEQRNAAASPTAIAQQIDAGATGHVWLVRADGYLTFGDQCAQLDGELARLRGGRVVQQEASSHRDGGQLIEYSAP